jgi:hypothetical protein
MRSHVLRCIGTVSWSKVKVVYNVVKAVYRGVLHGCGIVLHGYVKVKCDVA